MAGAYSSLSQNNGPKGLLDRSTTPEAQSFPLQDQLGSSANCRYDDNDSFLGSDTDDRSPRREFRVTFKDSDEVHTEEGRTNNGYSNNDDDDDDDDDDDEEDFDHLDDFVPLASTKRYQTKTSSPSWFSRVSHPCKILATVCGTATVVSLAFALLSLLHLNNNQSMNQGAGQQTNGTTTVDQQPDNRFLKPPPGLTMEDFNVEDFQLPPWDWDINKFVPINITNGSKFTSIQWRNGEQYLAVDCPQQPNYRYHFPSFPKDEFRNHPTATQGIDDLLPLGKEPYVFVLCPPGQNNANVIFREFDVPEESTPESPPHIAGTQEAPQPLLDDVVMLLVDAVSRGKFLAAMTKSMDALQAANTTESRYRIFDFEHYNVLGQNSPPNKAFIYSGQSIENMNHGPKHWLWDVFEEQGFTTAHTDGECGGQTGVHDYTSGAITYEYSHIFRRIPAQYQMAQPSWCENHDMHVVSKIWGQSCVLSNHVNYDKELMGGMRWNTPYCAGHKAIHEFIMDDLEGWLASKKGNRRFATYSFMDAHSPDHHHISFDEHLGTLFRKLLIGQDGQPPLLSPRSTLIIMADHGLHYGRETYTFPGFLHHKIPPLFMALPKTFLQEQPALAQNLEINQRRIISHLDLHQTFLHLAYGDFPVNNNNNQSPDEAYSEFMTKFIATGDFRQQFHAVAPNGTSYAQKYGRSLLLPIDEKRTCVTAGIPQDWCAFQPFLDLDPAKALDARFMRGVLVLLSNRMNNLTKIHHVDDVCHPASLTLVPELPKGLQEDPALRGTAVWNGTFEEIGTEDLVMESAYANAEPSKRDAAKPYVYDVHSLAAAGTRVFYFMIRDRHRPNRKYSVTMRQDDLERGVGDRITIQQMSAYSAAWSPCAARISQGGKAIGEWHDVIKHFCVCD